MATTRFLTEQQADLEIERATTSLEKRYLSTPMTEAEYEAELKAIDRRYTGLVVQGGR